ncbi:MAG: PorT family protein [Prevotella sp.]|nr:PorT family protein [Prevotella sp.]
MKRFFSVIMFCIACLLSVHSQERTVENRPYTDLRPFHFGVLVGTHLQDIEVANAGMMVQTNEDGTTVEKLISCDQDRWDAGFTVGVLGELRLSSHLAFRLAPSMYFGTRHLTFHNFTDQLADGQPVEFQQEMKSVYISSDCNLIFAAKRFNNHRPYVLAGLNPMFNLSGKSEDILRLKKFDCYLEVGVGCDFYLPFFKLRPELKFGYSLIDAIDGNHPNEIKDKNLLMYSRIAKKGQTKIIGITFYFE